MREYKGKSLTHKLDKYVVVDLETTGYCPGCDEIIEFAAIKVENGIVVSEYQTLIKPDRKINSFITELTGITNEMLSCAPTFIEVAKDILTFIGNNVIVGHNVNFDINFLYDALEEELSEYLSNDFEDTLRLSRKLFKEFENHQLNTCCLNLNKEYYPSHRAMNDVLATNELIAHIYEYVDVNNIDLIDIFKKKKKGYDTKKIAITVDEIDDDNPIYGLSVCFTGTLEKMDRRAALQMVANLGGIPSNSVTKKTNLLVLGDVDYKENIFGIKSQKYVKAEELILKGYDLKIITETVFFDMIDDDFEILYYR